MKLSKLTAAVISAATAVSSFTMYSPGVPAPATVFAEDIAALAELPDWIPNDHASALEFRNTYGSVHISNGLICVVYPERTQYGKSEDTYGLELRPTEKMGQLLKKTVYTSEECETCFDVFVYQPLKQGELTLTLVDPNVQIKETDQNWQPPTVAEYTDKKLNITETDIYSWLPDSEQEFRELRAENPYQPAVFKDNYVLFLISEGIGTPYEWTVNENESECFELEAVSSCSYFSPTPVEGGSSNKIYAYKAVKDGYGTISYGLKAVYKDNEEVETMKADCVVYDDAQHVMLAGQMKVTLADYDTGKPLELTPDINTSISTLITTSDDLSGSVSTGPILPLYTNPSIHESIGGSFDSDTFILKLDLSSLPDGYSAPDDAYEIPDTTTAGMLRLIRTAPFSTKLTARITNTSSGTLRTAVQSLTSQRDSALPEMKLKASSREN